MTKDKLIQGHISFLIQAIETLKLHEHNDPILQQLEVEMDTMIVYTEQYLEEIENEQSR